MTGLWSQEEGDTDRRDCRGSRGLMRVHGPHPQVWSALLPHLAPNGTFLGRRTGARGCVLGPSSGVSLTWNLRGGDEGAEVACATRDEECHSTSVPMSTQQGGSHTQGPSRA